MEEVVIIGGGIAGLSCLNSLLDKNRSPLLLEGATIGTPKMCGEFLAPQTVPILERWGIVPIQKINQARYFSNNKRFTFDFAMPAGAISRSDVELLLAQRARDMHGRIREHSRIKKITPATKNSPYILFLESGEEIRAKSAIFATGRYGQESGSNMLFPYYGIKIHFNHIVMPSTLLMYSYKDAYLGVAPISNDLSNCACLVKKELIDNIGSCKKFLFQLIEKNEELKQVFKSIDLSSTNWFESCAPEFQRKTIPSWPSAYWIGDALASLHPAIGSGFAHSIDSALMAADYYCHDDAERYLKVAKKSLNPKVMIGKLMHQIMLNPILFSYLIPLIKLNPWLVNTFLKLLEFNNVS